MSATPKLSEQPAAAAPAPPATVLAGTAAPAPPAAADGSRRRRVLRAALFLVMVGALVIWAADWVRDSLLYVHETDARVVADMVSVSSRVDGWVAHLRVASGDRVAAGQAIAVIDSRAAELRLAELEAGRAVVAAERARVTAERTLVDRRTRNRLRSETSELAAAEAMVESLEYELSYARSNYERSRALSKTGVVSAKALEQTRTAYLKAKQQRLRAEAEVAAARAQLDEARAERHQLVVLDGERVKLEHREAEIEARVRRQRLVIEDHTVRSSVAGVVSKTFVLAGEFVRSGQRIALLHDPEHVWVEANIRETEIRRVRPGQRVKIVVDAYPDQPIVGRVERIGQVTTGEFALLPSPNPSGNFTKVTQRLPVRMRVEARHGVLKPGMLVEVYIDVGDR